MPTPREPLSLANLRAWDHLYGATPSLVWGDQPIGFLPEFLPALAASLAPGRRVLDAATGEGRNLAPLSRLGAELHACDGSARAIEKIPAHLKRQIRTEVCDLYALPYPDGHFHAALLADAIETLPEPGRALSELHRVLAPGGRLLCNIPGMEDEIAGVEMAPIGTDRFLFRGEYFYQFYSEGQAVALMIGAGFNVLQSEIRSWSEEPHPGFRGARHWHTSRVFLAEKR